MTATPTPATLYALEGSECRIFSQNGEDGILRAIFSVIGVHNRSCVEFGVGDGSQCNTRLLVEDGWDHLWMDSDVPADHPQVRREQVNAENICSLLNKYDVPTLFDCLSIDTDFNDPYLLAAILKVGYQPRVIVVEYNAACGPHSCVAVRYDPQGRWRGTNYFGGSLGTYVLIGARFDYALVYCEATGTNAFFVQSSLLDTSLLRGPRQLWRPPTYAPYPPDANHTMVPFSLD